MPSHKIHAMMEKLVLGKTYLDVDRWIDEPYKYLGKRHRVLRHSPLEIMLKYHSDPNRLIAGLLHIALDYATSRRRR